MSMLPAGRQQGLHAGGGCRGPTGDLNTTEIREWARAQGIDVKTAAGCPLI
jgi:hypothetical protein